MRKHIKIANTIFMILLLSLLSVTTVFAYTDQELCDMALQHYSDRKGSTPSYSVIDSASGNSVTIHLYNVDGNHTTTYDWYTVDRVSGAGTNLMGEPINLSPYAPAPQGSAATDSEESQDTAIPNPTEESENIEKPEETDESNDTGTNVTGKPDDNHKTEDDAEETGSSSETAESASRTALTATQNGTSGNSSTKNILLAIAAISAISGITGVVILRRAKPTGKILCPSCGETNMIHSNFCTRCGKPIEPIGGIKRFLQCFKSTNTACRVGSWMTSLSIIVFLASVVSVLVLPNSTSDIDTPIIVAQHKKESTKTAESSYEDYLTTGRKQLTKKDFVQAEKSFQKAIELEPEQTEAYRCLIDTYVDQEDMEKAAEAYKDTIEMINDNYSTAHSLLDDGEELYLNAIDFFESQDDEEYAFQLTADLLNMTSNQDTIARLEEKQKKHEQSKRYAAYNQLLTDYTATYGEGTATGQGYNSYLSGLCFAKLIDFNQDGDEELLIAYYNAEKTKGIWVHEVEVWVYNNELRKVFANQSLSDGGMSGFVALSDINGKPCISTGTLGMPSKVSMWGYTGEQFTEVGSINYDPGVQYIVNGASVTIEECQSALSQWENEIIKYWLVSPEQDGNLALTELNNTRSTLQNLTATTAQQ